MRGGGATGERAAATDFEALYHSTYATLLRAAYAITLDLEVAREISQEAFLRLWERRAQLAPDSNEKAWLLRVATNLAISHRRGLLARLRHRTPPVTQSDPALLALARIEGDAMRRLLLALKPRDRAVLALRYEQDRSFAEIGAVFGRPEATVRTWCHRALSKLQQRMQLSTDPQPIAKELTQ
jgi:RNA polymerase sigma factor (sigma-70 family)